MSKTVYRRSRPGVTVQRLRAHKHYLKHDRDRAVPALFKLPTELRLAIWTLVIAPETYESSWERYRRKRHESGCFSFVESPPPPPPPPPIPDSLDAIATFGIEPDDWRTTHLPTALSFPPRHEALECREFARVRPPPMIMVCKRMAQEVLPIFFSSKRWSFDCPAQFDFSKHLPYLRPGRGITSEQRKSPILSEMDKERSQSFIKEKLERIQKNIDESDIRNGATAFPFRERTYRSKKDIQGFVNPFFRQENNAVDDLSDFPLAERLPWGTWSWIRAMEHAPVELKFLQLNVHLDKHMFDVGPACLNIEISFVERLYRVKRKGAGGPGSKVIVSWPEMQREQRLRPWFQEIQFLLEETVGLISSRKNFRGFTLLEVEILASVFQFEAWECEEDVCWLCGRRPEREDVRIVEVLHDFQFEPLFDIPAAPVAPRPVEDEVADDEGGDGVRGEEGDGDGDEAEAEREGKETLAERTDSGRSMGSDEGEFPLFPGEAPRRRRRRVATCRVERTRREKSTGAQIESSNSVKFIRDLERSQEQMGELEQYP